MRSPFPARPDALETAPRQVYRQTGMLVSGVLLTIACLIIAVLMLVSDGLSRPRELLWPIAGLLVVWVVFVRPCVVLTQEGVLLRNLVRDVLFRWPAVELVHERWNLKVSSPDDRTYGSWAIAAQRPKRPGRGAGGFTGLGRIGGGGGMRTPEIESVEFTDRPASAAGVAGAIRRGRADHDDAVARGLGLSAAAELTVRPAGDALAALVAALLCVLVALT